MGHGIWFALGCCCFLIVNQLEGERQTERERERKKGQDRWRASTLGKVKSVRVKFNMGDLEIHLRI